MLDLTEINRMQSGGTVPAGQVIANERREEKETNGSSIPGLSDSPVSVNSGQAPPTANPEIAPGPRPPPRRQFRRPADVFDSKLYQPTKLSEKVFIPVKDYPKVGAFNSVFNGILIIWSRLDRNKFPLLLYSGILIFRTLGCLKLLIS